MQKAIRIILGVAILALVLHMADLATRDCRLAPYVYDDCMWIGLRTRLGLPASRFLRMAVVEFVGIVLGATLYVAFRYVFPIRRTAPTPPDAPSPVVSKPQGN